MNASIYFLLIFSRYGRKVIAVIRSVSRFAVEINKPDSPYFERVICFVRPQYAENGSIDLHRAAMECINELNDGIECSEEVKEVEESVSNPFLEKIMGLPKWVLMAGAAAAGSVLSILGVLLII